MHMQMLAVIMRPRGLVHQRGSKSDGLTLNA